VTPDSLPKPDVTTKLRNLLYALEWWLFGGFAVFIWLRWCLDEVRGPDEGPQDTEPRDPEAGHRELDDPQAGGRAAPDAAVASGS
jgi:hypothetical protein